MAGPLMPLSRPGRYAAQRPYAYAAGRLGVGASTSPQKTEPSVLAAYELSVKMLDDGLRRSYFQVVTSAKDDVVLPALLRASRGAYGRAIIARLHAGGFDDVPGNGSYVLGGIVNHGGRAGDLVRQLGVTKQAASQLLDTLVLRGYLEREVDPDDRRRVIISATDRGRAAAAAIQTAVAAVDRELATLITPDELAGLRIGLIALCDIRDRLEDEANA